MQQAILAELGRLRARCQETRTTPLGTLWRGFVDRRFTRKLLRLARPEAVLESVRRSLNAMPVWQRDDGAIFPVQAFPADGEPTVEEEAAWLEQMLADFGFSRPPRLSVPWCPVNEVAQQLVFSDPAAENIALRRQLDGERATRERHAAEIVGLKRQLDEQRAARKQLEDAIRALYTKVAPA